MEYLWKHGIDLLQDAVIKAAIYRNKQATGMDIDRHTMTRIIILKYGEDMGKHAPVPERLLKKYKIASNKGGRVLKKTARKR